MRGMLFLCCMCSMCCLCCLAFKVTHRRHLQTQGLLVPHATVLNTIHGSRLPIDPQQFSCRNTLSPISSYYSIGVSWC